MCPNNSFHDACTYSQKTQWQGNSAKASFNAIQKNGQNGQLYNSFYLFFNQSTNTKLKEASEQKLLGQNLRSGQYCIKEMSILCNIVIPYYSQAFKN